MSYGYRAKLSARGSLVRGYDKPYRLNVDLLSDEKDYPNNSERSFHVSIRFDKDTVVFNTQKNGQWDREVVRRGVKPFARDSPFEITLFVTPRHYEVSVHGQFFYMFTQREQHHHSSVRSLGVRDETPAASGPGFVIKSVSVEV